MTDRAAGRGARRGRPARLAGAGLLVAAALLAGCEARAPSGPAAAAGPTAPAAAAWPGGPAASAGQPRPLGDFTLTSHEGAPLRLSDLRGRPVLLFFGYTSCPDACPTTLAEFRQVKAKLGPLGPRAAFVFVSVDGKRDTPEVLARYLGAFDPDFIGLTGDEETIRAIGREYGLYFRAQEVAGTAAPYLVDHTAATYLIDPQGRLRKVYSFGTSPDAIAADVRALLGPA